jgi:hypothetical protein
VKAKHGLIASVTVAHDTWFDSTTPPFVQGAEAVSGMVEYQKTTSSIEKSSASVSEPCNWRTSASS